MRKYSVVFFKTFSNMWWALSKNFCLTQKLKLNDNGQQHEFTKSVLVQMATDPNIHLQR